MSTNLNIRYRHSTPSVALSWLIEEEAHRLEMHLGQSIRCHVTVDPFQDANHARHCRIQVEVSLQGLTLVANRVPTEYEHHDDPYLSVRHAFKVIRRQADRLLEKSVPSHARITH